MTFSRLVILNLLRHKTRNLLTLAGITASVVVLYSILAFNQGFMANLDAELDRTGLHFLVVPVGCPHEVAALILHGAVTPTYLEDGVKNRVETVLGETIELVTPILVFQEPNESRHRLDLIHGMDFDRALTLKPWWRIRGKIPEEKNEILVGHEIAEHDGLKPGDVYKLGKSAEPFIVAGILEKTSSKDDAFVYLDIGEAQRLVGKPFALTALGIKLKSPEGIGPTTANLVKQVPGIQIVTISQIANSIGNLAAAARVLSLSIAVIAVIIGAIGVMNSILMTVFERTQEIGMMRAVGASRRHIFRIVVQESVILTVTGGFLGILLSVALSRFIETFVKSFMPYVPEGTMISLDPFLAFGCLLFTISLGILSGLYPAAKAAAISPIAAIRS